MNALQLPLRAVFLLLASSLAVVAFPGCAADDASDSAASQGFSMSKGCRRTYCEEHLASKRLACQQCTDACFRGTSCNLDTQCALSCSGYECDASDNEICLDPGWVAHVPPADPAVRVACEKMTARRASCKAYVWPDMCEILSHVYRPEAADWLGCIAQLPCDEIESGYVICSGAEPIPLGTMMADALGPQSASAWIGNEGFRTTYDHLGAWLRDDVREAGLACTRLPDEAERIACVGGWHSSVQP
jgi:hypothetical protein